MRATISNIHEEKTGTGTVKFIRVQFVTESGGYAKTDICPRFMNYHRWKRFLQIGVTLDNLRMKSAQTVDADSYPELSQPSVEKRRSGSPSASKPRSRSPQAEKKPTCRTTALDQEKRVYGNPEAIPSHSRTGPDRQLTHQLTYNRRLHRWSCQCGHVLGRDGHAALYAQCPLTKPKEKPDEEKTTKKKAVRSVQANIQRARLQPLADQEQGNLL